jgi:hypothetical protein
MVIALYGQRLVWRMADSNPLEHKVLEDLRKTGYPTEIVSASVMQHRDWYVLHNPSYLDDIEGRSREFDLRAYRRVVAQAPSELTVGVYLITECKKSDKPWVFFTTPEEYSGPQQGRLIKRRGGPQYVFWSDHSEYHPLIGDDDLHSFHHYFQQPRRARTYHEPLKSRETADHAQMIYTAVQSAVKATLFHMKQDASTAWLRIYYPLIVFNGDMFEARVTSATDIDLPRTDYVQLAYHYIEPQQRHATWGEGEHTFVVDVVRMTYLEQFLATIEDEQNMIVARLGGLPGTS